MAKINDKTPQAVSVLKNQKKDMNFKAQCYLMDNLHELLRKRRSPEAQGDGKTIPGCYDNFFCIDGDPAAFLGKLFRKSQKELYINSITPIQLSALVPVVRLFKVEINPDDPTKLLEREFFFDVNFDREEFMSILGKREARSTGVGLQSCNWEFIGSNPAETKRQVKVQMKILFASMKDMVRQTSEGVSFLELIAPTGKDKKVLNKDYHQLRMEVGWACPPKHHVLFQNQDALVEAIKDTRLSMYLSYTLHELNFEQDGRVRLDINFWGRLESMGDSYPGGFNIFERTQAEWIQTRSNELNAKKLQAESELLDCAEKSGDGDKKYIAYARKKIEIAKERLEVNILDETKQKYEKLIKRLLEKDVIHWEEKKIEINEGQFFQSFSTSDKKRIAEERIKKLKNALKVVDKGKKLDNSSVLSERIPEVGDSFIIHYFFLGDLLDIIFNDFYEQINKQPNTTNKQRLMQERKISFTRFLIGSFMHDNKPLCIADITISLHYFSVWFSEKVIKKGRTIYSFNEFIRDLIMGLLAPVLGQRCKQDERNKTVRSMISMFLLEGTGNDGKTEPLSKSDELPKKQNTLGSAKNCSFNSDKIKSLVVGQKVDKPLDCIESKKGGNYFEYFFIHFTEETKDYRKADYKKDVEDGIYHFFPG